MNQQTSWMKKMNLKLLKKYFQSLKKNTIFLITHNKQLLKYCEKTLHFKNRKAELISTNEKIL